MLRDHLGFSDNSKLEYVSEWLNKGEQAVCAQTDYSITTNSTTTTSNGTQEYALVSGCKVVKAATYNGERLHPIDILETIDDTTPSTPHYYYIRQNYIGLWPIPNDTKTLKYYYISIGGNMIENDDVPIIPEEWQMLLIYYAALHYSIERDDTRAKTFATFFDNGLIEAIKQSVHKQYGEESPIFKKSHYGDIISGETTEIERF